MKNSPDRPSSFHCKPTSWFPERQKHTLTDTKTTLNSQPVYPSVDDQKGDDPILYGKFFDYVRKDRRLGDTYSFGNGTVLMKIRSKVE